MTALALALAEWAASLRPDPADLELADRSLHDTVAVALAASRHPVTRLTAGLPDGARWAVAAHVLDFDDLHMESTTHISALCVPTALATGGGARGYLAAAGVMARLGTALGWPHYSAGWHATCTAGAPACAAGAAVALGLDPERIATAIALAIPGAGGVQRAFGTDAKSLQAGFAVDAGIRAAALAAAGAQADWSALDAWMSLVGGDPGAVELAGPAVPGGLAIKIYPCCYALQRPISALAELAGGLNPGSVRRIVLRTPEATVAPLIHHRPDTGLQGKFSLEYAAAAALLDRHPGFASFTDEAVRRPAARRLAGLVETELSPGGSWLLDGELAAEVHANGEVLGVKQQFPPGAPQRPPGAGELHAKLSDCVAGLDADPSSWTWDSAAGVLARFLPRRRRPVSPDRALPLAGLTVVTLEQAVAAPFATRQLADLGARVIKVERPGSGDFARSFDTTVRGQASYFVWLNRGKESIELDIKSADGMAVLAALLGRADVLVQNLAPGAAERLGLGAAELRARHPRLIICSITGYGSDGPYRHKKAYDLLVQCEAGLLSVTGTPEEPAKAGISVADIAAGMYAYSGVLTALFDRERTGQGSSIEVAMLDALGEWMTQPVYYSVYGGQPVRRTGARHASISPYGPYSAAGGEQLFLGLQNDREWVILCEKVLHRPDLVTDSRFRTNPRRAAHDAELTGILEDAFRAIPADQLAAALDEAGIACARLRSPEEFAAHPQLAARDRWREVGTPGGPVRALLPPVSMDGREAAMGDVPAVGQHTAAICAELGFPPADAGA